MLYNYFVKFGVKVNSITYLQPFLSCGEVGIKKDFGIRVFKTDLNLLSVAFLRCMDMDTCP